jgi:hypothetical protein
MLEDIYKEDITEEVIALVKCKVDKWVEDNLSRELVEQFTIESVREIKELKANG